MDANEPQALNQKPWDSLAPSGKARSRPRSRSQSCVELRATWGHDFDVLAARHQT